MLKNMLFGAMAALCCLAAIASPATAAEIDFSPLLETGISVLNPVLVAVAGALMTYGIALLKRKTGIDLAIMQQGDNNMLHAGIQRGIDALERTAIERLHHSVRVEVNNPTVAAIASRMIDMSPALLNRMGVTEDRLRELVAERLQARLT